MSLHQAAIDQAVLVLGTRTGWPRSELLALTLRQLTRYWRWSEPDG